MSAGDPGRPADSSSRIREGYRVPSATTDALVSWPESFGTRFTIFVDTEEEFDWSAPLRREACATTAIRALPDAHRRFADRGVPLTYLVDYPIATSPEAIAVLGALTDDGRSEIGTQLHPWVNPPFEMDIREYNGFAGNLPLHLEEAKLVALTDAIERNFGRRPRVYRAGRYGVGPATPALLDRMGYRIDSSMRAGYDYSAQGGPDFTRIGNHGFRFGPGGRMIELPLTTVFLGLARRRGAAMYRMLGKVPFGRALAARSGVLSRVALTPEDMPVGEAMEAVRVAVGEGVRVLNLSFHSPSVEPGHTPYVRDARDLAAFHGWWDQVLALLDRLGVRAATVADLLAATDACEGTPSSAIGNGAGGL